MQMGENMEIIHWTYYVPYQENFEQALQNLRQEVFLSGEYRRFMSQLEQEHEKRNQPRTIQEVIQRYNKVRNYSVLGINRLSPYPNYYARLLFTNDERQFFLQSRRPTQKAIELLLAYDSLWTKVRRMIHDSQDEVFQSLLQELLSSNGSQTRLAEILLVHEDLWPQLHQWACEHLEFLAWSANVGKALPISREMLHLYFGTETPTRELTEQILGQGDIWNVLHPTIGYYAVLYKNDSPDELVFIGGSSWPSNESELTNPPPKKSFNQISAVKVAPSKGYQEPLHSYQESIGPAIRINIPNKETSFPILVVEREEQDFTNLQMVISRQPWDITLYHCKSYATLFSQLSQNQFNFNPHPLAIIFDLRYIDDIEERYFMKAKRNEVLRMLPMVLWFDTPTRERLNLPLLREGPNIHLCKAENVQQFLQFFLTRVWFGPRST